MPERPVTPSDCALAIALPLSREELQAELLSEGPSDFVGRMRAHRMLDRVVEGYAHEVALADEVLRLASSLDVGVARRATLADVARLTASHHVVSILAHAPSFPFEAEDILDPPLFAEIARRGRAIDQRRVRRLLRCRGFDFRVGAPSPDAGKLAEALNALLWTSPSAGPRRRGHLDRTRVEDAFPGAVRAKPVLELRDGLHTIRAVRAAIAPSFDGVLDLSACSSTVLTEALKRTTRRYRVLGTYRDTVPGRRLALYQIWLTELARARGPVLFTQLVRVVADALALVAMRRKV